MPPKAIHAPSAKPSTIPAAKIVSFTQPDTGLGEGSDEFAGHDQQRGPLLASDAEAHGLHRSRVQSGVPSFGRPQLVQDGPVGGGGPDLARTHLEPCFQTIGQRGSSPIFTCISPIARTLAK
jgi:hypothetical protein